MQKYIGQFYLQNLKPHFMEEEETIFKVLGAEHPLIKEAISKHRTFHIMIEEGFKNPAEIETFRA